MSSPKDGQRADTDRGAKTAALYDPAGATIDRYLCNESANQPEF
ncbi:MAG TPA: hypothetical protein VLE70_09350 [Anaerolineae bacterium]|nr:hypothetical protein [Anaerolineae bacterium]